MPGFGHGPFGHMEFGEWWWSHYVLYDLIPSLYKERDDDGFLFEYAQSLRPSFDILRRKIRNFGDIRDPLLVRAAATETQDFRLGKQVILRGPIEQSGVDGNVVIFGEFRAKTARFTDADKGKELTVKRSTHPENNKSVTIVSIIDGQNVSVTPRLSIDSGPVRWNVRQIFEDPPNQTTVEVRSGGTEIGKVAGGWLVNDGYASFEVRNRAMFIVPADEHTLLTERNGTEDGTIDSLGRLSTIAYQFSQADVGKPVFIANSNLPTNNGRFEIYGVDKLSTTDLRAVFSRLDILGTDPLSGFADSNGAVRYANVPGVVARVQHVLEGLSSVFSVAVVNSDITVTLATDALGRPVTTANAVVTAVNADAFASVLVVASAPGTGTGFAAATNGLLDVPGITLQEDSKLTWSMLPFGQLVLQGPTPKGLVDEDGIDGLLSPISATQATLAVSSATPFRSDDVGKILVLRGSQVGNDGDYAIADVPTWGTGAVVTLNGVFTAEAAGYQLGWEMRTASGNATSPLIVTASAPSMLAELAKDFGIEVDTQESEERQRSWVKYINEWADRKGIEKGYQILAAISGYDATCSQLFNTTFDISLQLPPQNVYEIYDVGYNGADASLTDAVGPVVTLEAPSALGPGGFALAQVGRYVRLESAASTNNNQLYEIIDFIDSTHLSLRAVGQTPTAPTAPDANNGSIHWSVIRLYTDLEPLRPNFDDFDSDRMNTLIPNFTVDKYCWEVPIQLGVGGPGGSLSVVAVAQQVDFSFVFVNGDIDVIKALGLWTLTDSDGRVAFLEAVPVAIVSATIGGSNSANTYVGFDPDYATTIRVRHVNPGPSHAHTTVSVVFGATTDVTVTLRTDSGGTVLATALEVVGVVDSDPIAAGLVVASTSPGDGSSTATVAGFATLTSTGVYRTFIGSAIPLALGPAGLEYVCQPQFSCDFCVSYRMLVVLTLDALLTEGGTFDYERVFERTMERLKEVTPAHVELVPRVSTPITATLNLQATIDLLVHHDADLYAPLTLLYDQTPVDASLLGTGDTIGATAPNMTLSDSAAVFTSGVIGLLVTITGATTAANNGSYVITAVNSVSQIVYTNPNGVAESFSGTWGIDQYSVDTGLTASITTP